MHGLQEIIDIPLLQSLLDSLNKIYPFPSAIIDNDGVVLAATAWQEICVKFHRSHPESEKGCIQSDKYIANHLHEANPAVTYRCPHGLVDNAVPIVIEGEHLGNFFTGQFFLEPPDLEFFKRQAATYGYDEAAYLDAVAKVPVWSSQQLDAYLGFLKSFTDALAAIGLGRLADLRAAALIAEQERFVNTLVNITPGIIYIYDIVEQRNVYSNERIQTMLGYSVEEVREFGGQIFALLMHPDDFQVYLEETYPKYAGLGDGETLAQEFRMKHKSGAWHWLACSEVIYLRQPDGAPKQILGVMLDITDRKRADDLLLASEAQFRLLFENMTEGVALHEMIYDDNGTPVDYRIDDVNDAFTALTGVAVATARGALASRLYGTGSPPYLQEYAEVVRSRKPFFFETHFPPMNKDFGISVISPKPDCFATIFLDITERKQAAAQLQRLNDELEQRIADRTGQLEAANKEMEAFSYSISHDLRSPLRGIDGWTQALLEDCGNFLDEQGRTHINRVRSEVQRMGALIDDLLNLSRLTHTEMRLTRVDLSALAEKTADRLRDAAPERQVAFLIQPGLITNADAHLLEIALTNLLGNAFKFTGKTTQARIEFGQALIEGQPTYYVRDNGAGFDPALAKRLFGAFQRLHKTSEYPGTGIGLTIVQRIVHRHGGRIWAEAAVNQGATFHFTLEESS